MDLYTADVEVRLNRRSGSVESLTERSTCHIRCDADTAPALRLCPRCHAPGHEVGACAEFGALGCPRCLEWAHWEDTCPAREEDAQPCKICQVMSNLDELFKAKGRIYVQNLSLRLAEKRPFQQCPRGRGLQAEEDDRGHPGLGTIQVRERLVLYVKLGSSFIILFLRDWFYEMEFRSWWQLNGCVGVPLYKIYKRNTEWRKEVS